MTALKRFICLLGLVLLSFTLQTSGQLSELLRQCDEAYAQNFIKEKLKEAIECYEKVLTLDANNKHALNRLSQAYYEWGFAFLFVFAEDRAKTREEQRAAYLKGREYGLRSLRLDPDFKAAEESKGLIEAIKLAKDVVAVLWFGNNAGRALEFERDPLKQLDEVRKVKVAFERAFALDEGYFAGAPLRSLGTMLANLPGFLGGDLERAKILLERAVAKYPEFLENHVLFAREYLVRAAKGKLPHEVKQLRDQFEKMLTFVLKAPEGDKFILWNRVAKKQAEELLAKIDELFPKN